MIVLKGATFHHFASKQDATKIVQGRKGMIKDPGMKEVGQTVRDKAWMPFYQDIHDLSSIPPLLVILITSKPYETWYTQLHVGVLATNRRECERNYIIR